MLSLLFLLQTCWLIVYSQRRWKFKIPPEQAPKMLKKINFNPPSVSVLLPEKNQIPTLQFEKCTSTILQKKQNEDQIICHATKNHSTKWKMLTT